MAKTTFSSGVIVTSQWLNGSQQIYFDGQDLDWHYAPLGLNSLVRTGPNGLDSAYVTLDTDQPDISPSGLFISGTPIGGTKVVSGVWNFGFDTTVSGNPVNDPNNAPRSYTSNTKFNAQTGNADNKFQALNEADLVTKEIVKQWVEYLIETLEVDNGIYYSAVNPACNNYSALGGSDVICPN
jgi:hypothetical protein